MHFLKLKIKWAYESGIIDEKAINVADNSEEDASGEEKHEK